MRLEILPGTGVSESRSERAEVGLEKRKSFRLGWDAFGDGLFGVGAMSKSSPLKTKARGASQERKTKKADRRAITHAPEYKGGKRGKKTGEECTLRTPRGWCVWLEVRVVASYVGHVKKGGVRRGDQRAVVSH